MEVGKVIIVGVIGAILGVIGLFIGAILGALIGALGGWFVGFTPLGTWILNFLTAANIHTNMVDLGTFCGFVGGFFKSSLSK